MKKGEFIFNTLILPVDFLMLILAGVVTYFSRTRILSSIRPVLFQFNLPFEKYIILVLFFSVVFILAFALSGLYSMRSTRSMLEEFFRISIASSAGIMGIIIYIFLSQELFNSRFLVLGAWFFAIVLVFLGRVFMRQLQKFLMTRYDFGVHRIFVIGSDRVSNEIVAGIKKNPGSGYRIVRQIEKPSVQELRAAAMNSPIDEVILANPNYEEECVIEIIDFCNENHIIFKFVPNIYQTLTVNFAVDEFNGIPFVELRRTALAGWGRVGKRFLDIVFSILALAILSPVFLIVAIAIKLDTPGPVFVRLNRVSRNKKIKLLKFRSMVAGAEELKPQLVRLNERQDSPLFKIKDDPRITRVGRFIRRHRIDEFPQFVNVLSGDISLVGPRPHQPDEIAKYQKHHKRVLTIKAGATGLAQISGSSDLPFEEEVALDTYYIEKWSLWKDIRIILLTIVKIFSDKSAA